MTEKPKLIIIEDHPIMREGLACYFSGTDRWNVTGTAENLEEAKKLLKFNLADMLLIDIQLDDGWGIDIIPWLKQQNPGSMPVMAVYSMFDDYAHVNVALGMGVSAYVSKRRDKHILEQFLFNALQGKICIDDSVQANLCASADIIRLLTKREYEILSFVKKGLSNKEIAGNLGISYRTVENIVSCIYDKTGVKSRLELQKL